MKAIEYHRIKSSMGALKRWGQDAHRRQAYVRRNAMFSQHDALALYLLQWRAAPDRARPPLPLLLRR